MFNIKYRPTNFEHFFGNEEIVNSLLDILNHEETAHAFMFTGASGMGKTTLARILAYEIGADESSIVEINAANTRGIDTVREIAENAKHLHISGAPKVYIMDEFQSTTSDAQNALLKIIEDSPKHCYFIFCTTNPSKILETVKNRCAVYNLKSLSQEACENLFDYVEKEEKLKYDKSVKSAILKYSSSPRQLLINMYKCMKLPVKEAIILLQNTVEGVKDEVIDICRMFSDTRGLTWQKLMVKVDNQTKEDSPESIRQMMFDYFAKVLKNSKSLKDVAKWTAVLETLDVRLEDNTQGINGLVYLLGRITIGLSV